jgi:hypothetical protein
MFARRLRLNSTKTIPPFHFIFFKSRVDLEIYWVLDVNELPVYSSFEHFRYAFTRVCPINQYIFTYYSTDLSSTSYLDFCGSLVKEVRMRLRRSPKVFYTDNFSTFSQQFEVALAYSEFGIERTLRFRHASPSNCHHPLSPPSAFGGRARAALRRNFAPKARHGAPALLRVRATGPGGWGVWRFCLFFKPI